MILSCLQPLFAIEKAVTIRLQTADNNITAASYRPHTLDYRLKTPDYRNQENYLSLKTQNSTLKISQNPFGFSGYYQDLESGNYYLNARYYSSTLKRFFSRDTYDLANRYVYCNGNPVNKVDPSGHMPVISYICMGLNIAMGGAAAVAWADMPALGFGLSVAAGGVNGVGLGFDSAKKTGKINWEGIGIGLAAGAISALAGYSIAKGLEKFAAESFIMGNEGKQPALKKLVSTTGFFKNTLKNTLRGGLRQTMISVGGDQVRVGSEAILNNIFGKKESASEWFGKAGASLICNAIGGFLLGASTTASLSIKPAERLNSIEGLSPEDEIFLKARNEVNTNNTPAKNFRVIDPLISIGTNIPVTGAMYYMYPYLQNKFTANS